MTVLYISGAAIIAQVQSTFLDSPNSHVFVRSSLFLFFSFAHKRRCMVQVSGNTSTLILCRRCDFSERIFSCVVTCPVRCISPSSEGRKVVCNRILFFLFHLRDLRGAIIVAGWKNFATEVKQSLEAEIKKRGEDGKRERERETEKCRDIGTGGFPGFDRNKGDHLPPRLRSLLPRGVPLFYCLNKAHN